MALSPGAARVGTLHILLPFGMAYFTSHWYRGINAIIAPDLVRELQLSAADLGLLSAAYFLVFSAFQLPLGILLDRFGPRRVNMVLISIAALGGLLFSVGHDMTTLTLARALVGLGVSAGLMAPVKATLMWFPAERVAAMNGWIFVTGFMGAIAATAPAQWLLEVTHWRGLFVFVAILCVCAVLTMWRLAPEQNATHLSAGARSGAWQSFWRIYRHPGFWGASIVAMTSQAVGMGIQTLWAGPWLRDVAALERGASANVLLAGAFAALVGSFSFGQLGSHLARRGRSPMGALLGGVSVFLLIQLLLAAGWHGAPLLLWMLFGFFSTAGGLVFSVVTRDFEPALHGRVITALNVLIFSLAFLCQWGIGAIINQWPSVDGHYHLEGYRTGFAVFLALQALALAWYFVKHRRQPPTANRRAAQPL